VAAAGELVFYSGSKLAPDLALLWLQQRWVSTPARPSGGRRRPASDEVIDAVAVAQATLRGDGEDGDGIIAVVV
jgi:hypothetical protein